MCMSLLAAGDLAQHRNLAGQPVDVVHGEIDLALVGDGEQVQHRVGRPAHGDIQRHGVLERGLKLAMERGRALSSSCS
jgi:hypothetical protein